MILTGIVAMTIRKAGAGKVTVATPRMSAKS